MMEKVKSIASKLTSMFKKAQKVSKEIAVQEIQPVARPSGRVRSRDLVSAAQKPAQAVQPQAAPAKKSKSVVFKAPRFNFAVKLDINKLKGLFSGLAEASIRSASKREIENFYSTKNYRAVMLSISKERTEENFLAVKRELKAQDVLISRFPGKIMKSPKLSQRKTAVENQLNSLENELTSRAKQSRSEADFRGRISSLDSQVSVFRDIKKLSK
jgi:hypothetical protein